MRWFAVVAATTCYTLTALPGFAAEDIWGKGNEISNVQGGVPQSATAAVGLGDGPGVRALCNSHFADMVKTDRQTRAKIDASQGTRAQKDQAWRAYADNRNILAANCAATYPDSFNEAFLSTLDTSRGPFPVNECGRSRMQPPNLNALRVANKYFAERGTPTAEMALYYEYLRWDATAAVFPMNTQCRKEAEGIRDQYRVAFEFLEALRTCGQDCLPEKGVRQD